MLKSFGFRESFTLRFLIYSMVFGLGNLGLCCFGSCFFLGVAYLFWGLVLHFAFECSWVWGFDLLIYGFSIYGFSMESELRTHTWHSKGALGCKGGWWRLVDPRPYVICSRFLCFFGFPLLRRILSCCLWGLPWKKPTKARLAVFTFTLLDLLVWDTQKMFTPRSRPLGKARKKNGPSPWKQSKSSNTAPNHLLKRPYFRTKLKTAKQLPKPPVTNLFGELSTRKAPPSSPKKTASAKLTMKAGMRSVEFTFKSFSAACARAASESRFLSAGGCGVFTQRPNLRGYTSISTRIFVGVELGHLKNVFCLDSFNPMSFGGSASWDEIKIIFETS